MDGVKPYQRIMNTFHTFWIVMVLFAIQCNGACGADPNGTSVKSTNNKINWWQIIIIAVLCFLVIIVIIIIFALIIKLRGRNNKVKDNESQYDKRLSEQKSKIPEENAKVPERSKTPFEIKASTASVKYSQPARENLQSAGIGARAAMPDIETNEPDTVVTPSDTYWEEKSSSSGSQKKEKKEKKEKKKKKKKIKKVERPNSGLDEERRIYGGR